MRKYKYILFDLDGTLIYSHPGIYFCIRYALEALGEQEPTETLLRKCIGPSLMYSFTQIFGLSEERAKLATAKYREKYSVTGVYENEPIEGVLEGLQALKKAGYSLAMATSKPKIYADIIAERWGFSDSLSVQVGSGIDGSFPTKASVIAEVMRQCNASADECLMVGDRFHDNEGAVENGMDCALLRVGYAEEGEMERVKPTYVFDGFTDLVAFLLQ
ncbi:MAG: HAD hydrolase-like protein [Clostridia bacterium]|nr:HAD hydrolase-like protein [Clostridia bacterium]